MNRPLRPAGCALALAVAAFLGACAAPQTVYPVVMPTKRVGGTPSFDQGYIDFARSPGEDLIQLRVRPSFYARRVALHPFFLCHDAEKNTWEQWEIWAGDLKGRYVHERSGKRKFSDGRPDEETTFAHEQYGTVRRWREMGYVDLGSIERVLAEWTGPEARRLLEVLRRPDDYPHVEDYSIWPGPNSNGYVRWALDEARVAVDLDPRMVGKDWGDWPLGLGAGLTPTRTGVHLDLLTLGVAAGVQDGVEVHLLGSTFGVDLWPPALKTPFGRLGLPEPEFERARP